MNRLCKLPECGKSFILPKKSSSKVYCSRSCSTINSNRVSQKRSKTKQCRTCENLILKSRTFCPECIENTVNILDKTLQEVWESAKYQASARLRDVARLSYYRDGGEYLCLICGYDTHVDICHVKDLHQYSPDSLVRDTCGSENLVALYKNHHWEFDNGHIEVNGVQKAFKPSKKET